jgi:hypothetical protein
MLRLARARSELLLGFDSVSWTETVNAFGLYQGYEYGCNAAAERPPGYPVFLEGPGDEGGWVRFDFGGNGIGLEAGMMAIDYCWRSLDDTACRTYVPIATLALDFYVNFYKNKTADGKFMLWPTQVLETYWCEWPGWTDCPQNDMPQLAGLTALSEAVLKLPQQYLTEAQRGRYQALHDSLPGLPTTADGSMYAPAWVYPNGGHNAEIPELFAAHPFRILTVGRAAPCCPSPGQLACRAASLLRALVRARAARPSCTSVLAGSVVSNVSLALGQATWNALPLAHTNEGWYYGGMQAAYLGLASQVARCTSNARSTDIAWNTREQAYDMVLERSQQPPPAGYRFPAFAQHYQALRSASMKVCSAYYVMHYALRTMQGAMCSMQDVNDNGERTVARTKGDRQWPNCNGWQVTASLGQGEKSGGKGDRRRYKAGRARGMAHVAHGQFQAVRDKGPGDQETFKSVSVCGTAVSLNGNLK